MLISLFPEIHFPLFVGPVTSESNNSHVNPPSIYPSMPVPFFIPNSYYTYNDYNESSSGHFSATRPETILGNSIMAAFGTAIASFGTLLSAAGFCALVQALFIKAHYARYRPEDVFFGRLQDGLMGISVGCIGTIFTIFGINELRESIKRIYQISHGLPFDKDIEA